MSTCFQRPHGFSLSLLKSLFVWPSFMITLLIHSSWHLVLSKGCSSSICACKMAIESIFWISASILSLLMPPSLSLFDISHRPPPHLLHLQHHLHPRYLTHPIHPLEQTNPIYLPRWILLLSYHYHHHHLLPLCLLSSSSTIHPSHNIATFDLYSSLTALARWLLNLMRKSNAHHIVIRRSSLNYCSLQR